MQTTITYWSCIRASIIPGKIEHRVLVVAWPMHTGDDLGVVKNVPAFSFFEGLKFEYSLPSLTVGSYENAIRVSLKTQIYSHLKYI